MPHSLQRSQTVDKSPSNLYNHVQPSLPSSADQRNSRLQHLKSAIFRSSSTSRSSSRSYAIRRQSLIEHESRHSAQKPREIECHRRGSAWHGSGYEPELTGSIFERLPREVYDCILEQLEQSYLWQTQGCSTCYLQDLCSLSLTSRAWGRASTLFMYRVVRLSTTENHPSIPRSNVFGTGRLKLLRRTLRQRPSFARSVRDLDLHAYQTLISHATIEKEEIINLVASLVMACPNLERLIGFHIPFTHSFDRLSHALSTRQHLKERVWVLAEPELETDSDDEYDISNSYYHAAADPMERFLELNSNHSSLSTLVLHQQDQVASIPLSFRAMIGTFRQLPSLAHLSISGFSATSFSNTTLNALPPNLQSLRLEDLPGVTDTGLRKFATSRTSSSLLNLTLINMDIANLKTVALFLSPHLPIKRLTLSQDLAPSLPESETEIPTLSSKTLTYLHWETHSSDPITLPCRTTTHLTSCIQRGNFPNLRTLRPPRILLHTLRKTPGTPPLDTTPHKPEIQTPKPQPQTLQHSKSQTELEHCEARTDSPMSTPTSPDFPADQSLCGEAKDDGEDCTSTSTTASSSSMQINLITPEGDCVPQVCIPQTSSPGLLDVAKGQARWGPAVCKLEDGEGEGRGWITRIEDVLGWGEEEVGPAVSDGERCMHEQGRGGTWMLGTCFRARSCA